MRRTKRLWSVIVVGCWLSAWTASAQSPQPPPPPPPAPVAEPAPPGAEPAPPDPAQLLPGAPLPPPLPLRPTSQFRNPAMRRAGVILVIAGVVSAGAGVALSSTAATASSLDSVTRLELRNLGIAFWSGCAGLIATGIPLWLLGSRSPLPRPTALRYIPQILVGTRNVAVRWTF